MSAACSVCGARDVPLVWALDSTVCLDVYACRQRAEKSTEPARGLGPTATYEPVATTGESVTAQRASLARHLGIEGDTPPGRPASWPFDPEPRALEPAQNGYIWCDGCESVQPVTGHECAKPSEWDGLSRRDLEHCAEDGWAVADACETAADDMALPEWKKPFHRAFDNSTAARIEALGSVACGFVFDGMRGVAEVVAAAEALTDESTTTERGTFSAEHVRRLEVAVAAMRDAARGGSQ